MQEDLETGRCDVCGQSLPVTTLKRGRPRLRHDACRQLAARLAQVECLLSEISFTGERGKVMKGNLFHLRNTAVKVNDPLNYEDINDAGERAANEAQTSRYTQGG